MQSAQEKHGEGDESSTSALPPNAWTPEERAAYADSLGDDLSMFAEDGEQVNPVDVAAMQALLEEGETPQSLALHFKELGNAAFKRGKKNKMYYSHAIEHYGKALFYLARVGKEGDEDTSHETEEEAEDKEGKKEEKEEKEEEEVDVPALTSTLLANRAMAHLCRKNFRQAYQDAQAAVEASPGNVKAHYRKAKALLELRRYAACVQVCLALLEPSGTEEAKGGGSSDLPASTTTAGASVVLDVKGRADLEAIRQTAQNKLDEQRRAEEARRRAVEQRRAELERVWGACVQRGVKMGFPLFGETVWNAAVSRTLPSLDREAVHPDGSPVLMWPLLFLYPEHQQSDFVEAANESDMLAIHMAMALPEAGDGEPPPWDRAHEYVCSNAAVYIQLNATPATASVDELEAALVEAQQGSTSSSATRHDEAARVARKQAARRLEQHQASLGASERVWLDVHPGCTLIDIARAAGYIVPGGVITCYVYARNNAAHTAFLSGLPSAPRQLEPDPSASQLISA